VTTFCEICSVLNGYSQKEAMVLISYQNILKSKYIKYQIRTQSRKIYLKQKIIISF